MAGRKRLRGGGEGLALAFGILALSLALSAAESEAAGNVATLPDVVVTATRGEIALQNAPGAITVITAADIADQPARDIVDVLAETAGISLSGRGVGGRKTISIRGAENRHTLILVDGRRIAASDAVMGHSNYENSWIPLENIERIEVVRGPLSALYGSEALGGVVNIITKAPTDRWRGNFKLGGGSPSGDGGDTLNLSGTISGPLLADRVGLSLTMESLRESAVPDKNNLPYTDIEGRKIRSISPKLYLTPNENHRIELHASLVDEERELVGVTSNRVRDTLYELDKYSLGVGWSGKVGSADSKINIYRSQIDKQTINTFRADGSQTFAPDIATNDVLDGQSSFKVAGQLVTLGGEYRNESIEAGSLTAIGGKETITHQAAFAQAQLSLLDDRLLLTPGMRYDHHEFFGSEISPRLYVLYKLTDQVNLKAGYGQAFNAPTAKQISPGYFAQTGPHTFYGNPAVQPETAKSYEIGVEYFGERFVGKTFYFQNDIDSMIAWNQIGRVGPRREFQAENIEQARIRGIEAELQVKLPQNFGFTTNYTFMDTEDRQAGESLTGRPEHSINIKLKHHLEAFGLDSVLRFQYVGKQAYGPIGAKEYAPTYSLWHAALSKTLTENLSLQLGIENIGDLRLREKSELFPYQERGRFFFANLRGSF